MDLSFIIIDDSELDCFIAEKLIRHTGKCLTISSFTAAKEAWNFVREDSRKMSETTTVILLDILMPVMSGFDFLERFEALPEENRRKYIVIAITSSLNKKDTSAIKTYPSVIGVIDKPIQTDLLTEILKKNSISWPEA